MFKFGIFHFLGSSEIASEIALHMVRPSYTHVVGSLRKWLAKLLVKVPATSGILMYEVIILKDV